MPEYSSTTITPADGVQVPSMNGSTSGNFLLSALRDYILASKGQANGLASLGSDGKLTLSQLPDLADDVIVVASYAVLPATGTAGKLYITADNNKMYRWDSDLSTPDYVELSVDLSEYAKLTDLAAEETARETSDANLNNAITALDHRLENLEQAKGDYVVSAYKDGSITPSGKGNWAVVEGVEGVSRCENNALPTLDSFGLYHCSLVSYSEGVLTVTGFTDTGSQIYKPSIVVPSGRTVLGGIWVKPSKATYAYLSLATTQLVVPLLLPANTWTYVGNVKSLTSATSEFSLYINVNGDLGTSDTVQVKEAILTDLTLYFGGTIPSDADTIAKIQQNYPHLLTPSEYGTRIVDSSYTGVESGIDLVNGSIDGSGNDTPSDSRVRSSFVPVSGAITIAIDNPSAGQIITEAHYYNSAKSWLSYEAVSNTSKTLTIPSSCKYLKFILRNSNQTTTTPLEWAGKLLINNVHIERFLGVLSFPSTTLKSAGSVRDTLELNVEVVVDGVKVNRRRQAKKVGQVDLGTLTSASYDASYSRFRIILPSSLGIAVPLSARTETVIIPLYECLANNEVFDATWNLVCYIVPEGSDVSLYIHDHRYSASDIVSGKATWLNGVTMNYPLATQVVTLSVPILDNTLLTESGGRMATVQTGTVVDGIADLGFITL